MLAARIGRPALCRWASLNLTNRSVTSIKATAPLPILARTLHAQAIPSEPPTPLPQGNKSPVQCTVIASQSQPKIAIQWEDGHSSQFDNQFLFDHCRCPACFHDKTRQRLKTLLQVSTDVGVQSATVTGDAVKIVWATTPAHESTFPLSFLRQASYDPPLSNRAQLLDHGPQTIWGSSIAQSPPTVAYEAVMPESAVKDTAERGVLEWLNKLDEFGFCFVSGVPATTEATEQVIRRMAHIRETHYGGFWDFTADMSKGDLAYSNQSLPAHTDTAYFTDPAGLQIFHCLSHPCPPGTGGETLLVDAFFVASEIKKRDPQAYDTLSHLPVAFHASGNEDDVLRPPISQPVLRHDHQGRLHQARWNNEDRCVLGEGWTPDAVREWYRAARVFEDVCTSKEAEYWVKLNPGTVVVIDNWRVMHGRAAFTGQRRMCGAYVGADDWRSRRRALIKKFNAGSVDSWSQGW